MLSLVAKRQTDCRWTIINPKINRARVILNIEIKLIFKCIYSYFANGKLEMRVKLEGWSVVNFDIVDDSLTRIEKFWQCKNEWENSFSIWNAIPFVSWTVTTFPFFSRLLSTRSSFLFAPLRGRKTRHSFPAARFLSRRGRYIDCSCFHEKKAS